MKSRTCRLCLLKVFILLIFSIVSAYAEGFIATAYYDSNGGKVRVYTADGTLVQNCAVDTGTSSVAFAQNGDLYFLEQSPSTGWSVWSLPFNGIGVNNWNTKTQVCTMPEQPWALALDDQSVPYISSYSGDKVYRYPGTGTAATLWNRVPGSVITINQMSFGLSGTPSTKRLWTAKQNLGLKSLMGDNSVAQDMNIAMLEASAFGFGPDNQIYAVNSTTHTIDIYNPATGAKTSTFATDATRLVVDLAYSPSSLTWGPDRNSDGTMDIYVGFYYNNNIAIYSGVNGSYLGSINNSRPQWSISACGGTSGYIATAYYSGTNGYVRIYNAAGTLVKNCAVNQSPTCVYFGPNNDLYLLERNTGGSYIVVKFAYTGNGTWANKTLVCIATTIGDDVWSIAVDSAGLVYIGSVSTNEIYRWDGSSNSATLWASVPGNISSIGDMRFGPSGNNSLPRLWIAKTKQAPSKIIDFESPPYTTGNLSGQDDWTTMSGDPANVWVTNINPLSGLQSVSGTGTFWIHRPISLFDNTSISMSVKVGSGITSSIYVETAGGSALNWVNFTSSGVTCWTLASGVQTVFTSLDSTHVYQPLMEFDFINNKLVVSVKDLTTSTNMGSVNCDIPADLANIQRYIALSNWNTTTDKVIYDDIKVFGTSVDASMKSFVSGGPINVEVAVPLRPSRAFAFGPSDGQLYAVNSSTNTIDKYNPSTGVKTVTFTTDTTRLADNGSYTPYSLIWGPDRDGDTTMDIYVGFYYNNSIAIYSGANGSYLGSINNGHPAFSVTSCAGTSGYIACASYDGNGSYVNIYNSNGTLIKNCSVGSQASSAAFGANNDLYVLENSGGYKVSKFPYSGSGTWGTKTQVCTVLAQPRSLTLGWENSADVVYVGAYATNNIYRYVGTGSAAVLWKTVPGANVLAINDMRFGPSGSDSVTRLWIANQNLGIESFMIGGDLDIEIPLSTAAAFGFGPDNMVYAVNADNHTIDKYDSASGNYLSTLVTDAARLINNGSYNPVSLTWGPDKDSDGVKDIYVGFYYNNNIAIYSGTDGGYLGAINNSSPVLSIAAWDLPPLFKPSAPASPIYSASRLSSGDILITRGPDSFTLISNFSTPNSLWVRGTTTNNYFTMTRSINTSRKDVIVVTDVFTNKKNYNLPIMMKHTVTNNNFKTAWASGFKTTSGSQWESVNPTTCAVTASSGIGLLPYDDVGQVHVCNSVANNGTVINLEDNYFVLQPSAQRTVTWAIVLSDTPDYFALINAARRLYDVNFQFDGPMAFLEFRDVGIGTMTDQQIADFITNKSVKWIASSILQPIIYNQDGWPIVSPHTTLYPSLDNSYSHDAADLVRSISPTTDVIGYFDCFLEESDQRWNSYPNDRVLSADGSQPFYPGRIDMKLFFPTTTNSWGTDIGACMTTMLDFGPNGVGYDGIFWDEFECSSVTYHYLNTWDGVSGDIDPTTHTLIRTKSSVELISQDYRLSKAAALLAAGKPLVGNGGPHTLSSAAVRFPRICETGSGLEYLTRAQLYTPISLGDSTTERSQEDCYRNMVGALDRGCVYYWYADTIRPTHPTLTKYMYPITPIELHNGYIIAVERILTNKSGLFGWGDNSAHVVHVFNDVGVEVYSGFYAGNVTVGGGTYTNLIIPSGWSAAIVRELTPPAFSLSGKVNLLNYYGDISTVSVTVDVGAVSYTPTLDAEGNFTILDVPGGTYDVRIKASHWLAKIIPGVGVSANTVIDPVDLINGDVVDNNEVDFSDINAVRAAYGSFPGDETWNERADVDGSGEVDFTDINIVRDNYGEIGD